MSTTVSRWDTFKSHGMKRVEYKITPDRYGSYCVDRSAFHPMSEAVKQLANSAISGHDIPDSYYDFPDGKDTGMRVPVDRMHGVSDITEISNAVREQAAELKESLQKAEHQSKRNKRMQELVGSPNESPAPAGQTSE